MRVTERMIRQASLSDLTNNVESLMKIQEQVSTTKRLNRPSDDPADARSAVKLHDAIAELKQYSRNVDVAQRQVSTADTALGDAGDIMQRASELAIEGANGSTSAADRANIAKEIEQLVAQLVQDASAKVGDQYIFSGYKVTTPPYTTPPSGSATVGAYQGDQGVVTARIGTATTMQVNVTADSVFQDAFDALQQLHTDLLGGGVQQATIGQLQAGLQSVIDGRAVVGARGKRLEDASSALADIKLSTTELLSNLEDADMTSVISKLAERQTTYEAALKVSASIMQKSLIDML
jgi:flagellar hook-associated protein 3 FlgL